MIDNYTHIETVVRDLDKRSRNRRYCATWQERHRQDARRAHLNRILNLLNSRWGLGERWISKQKLDEFTSLSAEVLSVQLQVIDKRHELSATTKKIEAAQQREREIDFAAMSRK